MTTRSRRSLRVLGALLLVALSVSSNSPFQLEGCESPTTAPEVHMPRSPEQLVHALEWAYETRSLGGFRELLTEDFVLACAGTGTTGTNLRTRENELDAFANLADPYRMPAVRELKVDFDENLTVSRDPRPEFSGSKYHAFVRSAFTVRFAEGTEPVQTLNGQLEFFIVRADDPDLQDEDAEWKPTPDPRVWYIQRLDDVTTSGAGWCGLPGRN